jgi:crossover junction endodeoxyribonuclease RuvC
VGALVGEQLFVSDAVRTLRGVVILGLDPGIASTGFGVVETVGARVRALASGVIRTTPRQPHAERLAIIHAGVSELIRAHGAAAAAVEELYVGPDPRGSMLLAQARGSALAACGLAAIDVAEYPVSTIKSAVCGFGRAEKAQVARMVRAILALETDPRSAHEADALAAAICHTQRTRQPALGGRT